MTSAAFQELQNILKKFQDSNYSQSLLAKALANPKSIPNRLGDRQIDEVWREIDRAIEVYEECYAECPTSPWIIKADNDIPRVPFNLGIEKATRNLYRELDAAQMRAVEKIARIDASNGVAARWAECPEYMQAYNQEWNS